MGVKRPQTGQKWPDLGKNSPIIRLLTRTSAAKNRYRMIQGVLSAPQHLSGHLKVPEITLRGLRGPENAYFTPFQPKLGRAYPKWGVPGVKIGQNRSKMVEKSIF